MSNEQNPAPVVIDVVSDVVCPWCYVGKRRLEAALQQVGDQPVELRWRPYQLDNSIPPGGVDRIEYMSRKFGSYDKVRGIHERLEGIGAEVGIPFAFQSIKRSPNTLDAHRLIRWATGQGRQDAVVEALFRAFFVEGRDIGGRAVLADIAGENGLDRQAAADWLASEETVADVRDEIAAAQEIGITGVPFFIFAGRYAVPGADAPEVLAGAIRKAAEAGQQG
jgi:predicted DsbA family dithiol-disulfide isomerase